MRDFLKEIREKVLVYDGSKGYMLQKLGMKGGECLEAWNVSHREQVKKVYSMYKEAGADVIQTNTFQGSRAKLDEYGLGERTYELNYEGARMAREVMGDDGFVAASIGPVGELFEPSGELTFDKAYEIYKEQVMAVAEGGVDIINFETFTDLAEIRAALIAAKENCNLPVICSVSFESNGRTLMGTDPYTAAVVLKSLGADLVGTNCSLGAEHLLEIIKKIHEAGGIPLMAKPNAGLPQMIDGKVVYNETAEGFAALADEFVKYGVRLIGGCCGTTPEFISALRARVDLLKVDEIGEKNDKLITSGVKWLNVEKSGDLNIGSINSTEDGELAGELSKGNVEFIVDKAIDLSCEGLDAIYINVDSIDGDKTLLANVVNTAQSYIKEPFILKTGNPEALESALRLYKGKAGVRVDGFSEDIMKKLVSIAEKYGSTIMSEA